MAAALLYLRVLPHQQAALRGGGQAINWRGSGQLGGVGRAGGTGEQNPDLRRAHHGRLLPCVQRYRVRRAGQTPPLQEGVKDGYAGTSPPRRWTPT